MLRPVTCSRYRRPSKRMLVTIMLLVIVLRLFSANHSPQFNDESQFEQETSEKTILVAACMNPGDALKTALKSWLAIPGISEFILVDWSSSVRVSKTVSKLLGDPRIKLITNRSEKRWIPSWAYNLAAKFVPAGSMMLKVDCDVALSADFLERHPMQEGIFYADNWKAEGPGNEKYMNGVFYIKHAYFEKVNGFDERLQNYGVDETDLYTRLTASGLTRKRLNLTTIHHLDHHDLGRCSRQPLSHLKYQFEKNRRLQALLPPWNQKYTQVPYSISVSLNRRGRFLVARKAHVTPLEWRVSRNTSAIIFRNIAERLLRSKLVPWSSLNQSTPYLIKMVTSYESGKMLIVHVQNGLTNRLKGLASGMAIANKTGRHFRLIWIPDIQCQLSFADLFSNEMDVWEEFESSEVAGRNFERYNYTESDSVALKFKQSLTKSLNHIYVKTKSTLVHDEVTPQAMHDAFSHLQLRPRIAIVANAVNATDMIGLHINAMNCSEAVSEPNDDACNRLRGWRVSKTSQSGLMALFIHQIDTIIEKNPNQTFFLEADSFTVVSELKKRYPGKISFIDCNNCGMRSKKYLGYATAKLWILSRTVEIFGSPLSSFSEIAGLIGNKQVKYAGLHFPDLPADHLTRPKLVGCGNGIIYTAYGSSKNSKAPSESNQQSTELLKSAQSFHNGLNGKVPISLFTNRHTAIHASQMHLFKSVHLVNVSNMISDIVVKDAFARIADNDQKQISVNLGKIQQLAHSPYEVTLYLDADTWLCENLTDFTELLGRNDIMLATTTHRRPKLHRTWDSGVILYRNSPIVQRFFRLWEELYVQKCILSGLDRKDTCALAAALDLSPLLRYKRLKPEYNFRLFNEDWDDPTKEPAKLRSQKVSSPIKILHLNKIIAHQSHKTCRTVNARRLLPRILGVTSKNQSKMYYSQSECDIGTKYHCHVDGF